MNTIPFFLFCRLWLFLLIVSFAAWRHFNLVPFISSSSYFLCYWGLIERAGPVKLLSGLRHLQLKPGKPTVLPRIHIEVEGENLFHGESYCLRCCLHDPVFPLVI